MSLPNSGPIKMSDLINILGPGGIVQTSMSQYAKNSSTYYSKGILGITDTDISLSQFYGKKKLLKPGFTYRIFNGYFSDDTSWFSTKTETNIGTTTDMSNINTSTGGIVPLDNSRDQYSVEWFGYFWPTVTGNHTFYINSDDASYLWIGSSALSGYNTSNCLINNGSLHGMQKIEGTIYLTADTIYPIRIQFGENYGGDNCIVSFTAPGISETSNFYGYTFYGLGNSITYPAESARILKLTSGTNNDGVYYINVNGTSTPTYCLMDSKWDGGGWMMLMKGTRGDTFNYDSNYWTDSTTTLNTSDTTRNDGDAKFNTMNYSMIKDVMALWPDSGLTGGSISGSDCWSWLENNYYGGGIRTTALNGFSSSNSRDSPNSPDPLNFSGFSDSLWSTQNYKRHVIGGISHLNDAVWFRVRWGFIWNNEYDFNTPDAYGGIGMGGSWSTNTGPLKYSGGDFYGCCGNSIGVNRTMRVELYGR